MPTALTPNGTESATNFARHEKSRFMQLMEARPIRLTGDYRNTEV